MPNYDKTKKVHVLSIIILTINMDGLYYIHFLMVDLNLLKIYQCLMNYDIHYTYYTMLYINR